MCVMSFGEGFGVKYFLGVFLWENITMGEWLQARGKRCPDTTASGCGKKRVFRKKPKQSLGDLLRKTQDSHMPGSKHILIKRFEEIKLFVIKFHKKQTCLESK